MWCLHVVLHGHMNVICFCNWVSRNLTSTCGTYFALVLENIEVTWLLSYHLIKIKLTMHSPDCLYLEVKIFNMFFARQIMSVMYWLGWQMCLVSFCMVTFKQDIIVVFVLAWLRWKQLWSRNIWTISLKVSIFHSNRDHLSYVSIQDF